jgi:hypothetical protein
MEPTTGTFSEMCMNASKRRGMGAVAGLLLLGLVATQGAAAAAPEAAAAEEECSARLTVELTPDVRDVSNAGFLSSLLNNHPGYRLELRKQFDPSLMELELSGPGPGYLCRNIVDGMRRDARVLSIHVDSAESPSTLTTSVPASSPELWGVPVSSTGIGSLYWAAHHPRRAWKVLLPVRSQDSGAAE